ncbi:hypothetical protein GV794_22425 [Nocardia cyriacigeorgica]|uniref:Uncharacterized protein n=2 Tax=Nocardia cyriacigeorgica TaxID=135487 RepID=A0A6P1D6D4_9NOCA|nr:hypothetical protein [Nocardia cyriacigeorgica]NEW44580.1 hypothetical protein [Nocardia cyriacigeorgica]NEW51920.1 hypothetical protein [Nocardia cyriacigeorgica]NEW58383.1 hypothetical protein [Nocardia cyriacigeorgica]
MLIMVLAVGLSAFGVGCSDGSEPSSEAEGTEPLGIGREVTVPIAAAVATVDSPGSEPRSSLRAGFPDGTVQEVTLRTDHRIQQQINDQPARDFSNPALTIPLTARTGAEGVDLTLGAVTTPDPSLSEALTAADGSHAGLDMSEFGSITALRLAPSPDTSNSARAAIEQAFYQAVYQSITLPDEPVGVGAVWTVRQEVTGGVSLDQVTTATLTERDGNRLTIDLAVAQTPKSRIWNLPNEAGTLQIEDYMMTGAGTIIVDLGLPLPVSGAIDIGGQQSYLDPRTDTRLRQTISTRVSWGE